MTLQIERLLECFFCKKLQKDCKIIKNQDSNDIICFEDFMKLLTEDNNNFNQILTNKEALAAWNNINSQGFFPVLS